MTDGGNAARPFEFAAELVPEPSVRGWTDKVRRLEDRGYDLLQVPDHWMGRFLGPITALTAAAMVTTRLRLGSLVFNHDFRHPVLLAKELATLDLLSEGRLEVGLGAGWYAQEYQQIGLAFDTIGTRIKRLEETIDVLQGAWSGGPFWYRGAFYQVEDLELWPTPHQQPHPPLMVGGGGPRLLRLAARRAQVINITTRAHPDGQRLDRTDGDPDAFTAKMTAIEQAGGDRRSEITIGVYLKAVVRTDRSGSAGPAAGTLPAKSAHLRGTPFVVEGDIDKICTEMIRWREKYGISRYVVYEPNLDAIQPVVERLHGR